jgi:excisionase family DNA binding protein
MIYTLQEAAEKMRISRTKLYQLVRRKEVFHYRIGGSIRFSEGQIQGFLDDCIDGPESRLPKQDREFL